MADPIEVRLGSVEYVRAEVTSKIRTGAQLVAFPVEIAVVAKGVKPTTEWAAGAWEAGPGANKAVARLIHTFSTAGLQDVYTRHTDNPEVPIKFAGQYKVV